MPIYLYWGDDDFAMSQAITRLRQKVLDSAWESFNYDKISPEQPNAVIQALNQALTPPFGAGSRFVWLADTTLLQRCPDDLLAELERTLPTLPASTVLLLTSRQKPDARLKVTKFLQKQAEVREFSQIPPWKTDLLAKQVRQVAQELGVKLTPGAIELLAESVGNDTRQLHTELEKLRLFNPHPQQPLNESAVAALVTTTTQNANKLAQAIRQGDTAIALELIADLLRHNEPALRIVSVLVGQFRTWLWVKLLMEAGERDPQEIAVSAEIGNPKRIYFLQQEVCSLSLVALQQAMPLLLALEASLKRGAEELSTLQTKIIELCEICRSRR